jgi:hypothetical protein
MSRQDRRKCKNMQVNILVPIAESHNQTVLFFFHISYVALPEPAGTHLPCGGSSLDGRRHCDVSAGISSNARSTSDPSLRRHARRSLPRWSCCAPPRSVPACAVLCVVELAASQRAAEKGGSPGLGASPQGNVIKTNLWVGLHPPVPPLARCLLSASSRSRDAGDPLAWVVVPPEKRRVPAAPRTLAAPSALWRTGLVMRPMNGTGVANVLAVADLCAPAQTRASGMRALRRCKLWRRLDVAARVPCRGAVLPWGRVPRECGLIRLQGRQRRRQTLALSPELLANVDMSLPVLRNLLLRLSKQCALLL